MARLNLGLMVRLAVALSIVGSLPVAAQEMEGLPGIGPQVLGEEGGQGLGSAVQEGGSFISSEALVTNATTPEAVNRAPETINPEPITQNLSTATTVAEWIAQIEASLTQITGVRVEATETGLQLVLETAEGDLPAPTTQTVGNALIADIPNAVLVLPDGNSFEQFAPAEGIALVAVTNEPGDRVRVAITGTDATPVVAVTATGLAVTLGEAVVGAEDDAIQVVVTGEQDEGYSPSDSSITRFDAPLLDTPLSVQVIPRQVFEDQGANTLQDVLQNASSISVTGESPRAVGAAVTIRGFFADNLILRNGVFQYDTFFSPNTLANVERVEVLGGPASILTGQVQPGGVLNLVTEQPLSNSVYDIEARYGSFNTFQGAIDLTGPLNEDRTVLYRFNAFASGTDTFIENIDSRREFFVAPVVSVQIGENTRLLLEGEYLSVQAPNELGLPLQGTIFGNPNGEIPRNLNIGDSEFDDPVERIRTRVGYDLEHQFSEDWSLRHTFYYNWFVAPEQRTSGFNALLDDGRTVERSFSTRNQTQDSYQVTAGILGNFSTGAIDHQVAFGVEYFPIRTDLDGSFGGVLPSIDIFNPSYGNISPTTDAIDYTYESNLDQLGVYLQDRITFSDSLILLMGGRFDSVTIEERFNSTFNEYPADAFSPFAGIVFKPSEAISLYGSYSRSFQPTYGISQSGDPFLPSRGTQFEVGVKVDVLDNLFATLALYDLTRTNVTTSDPNNPDFSIQAGKQRSQGVELNLSGEILPGWNIIAGYAYNNARVTEDNTIPEGDRLKDAPDHAFSLWSTYQIQSGTLEGLGLGLGLFYVGERAGDLPNTFELPSYLRTDAALFYRREQLRAALNIKNLFDIGYFASAGFGTVFPGDPRSVEFSLGWEF